MVRIVRILRHAPRLKVLLAGLWGGMGQILYISLLIMLLEYLYAVAGVVFFGGNDPGLFSDRIIII